MKIKAQRCGFCGRCFQGDIFIDDILGELPEGYCPNAQEEYQELVGPTYVTRDMAIDAGDLSLEGMEI